ncbi:hypothetical protein UFOVP39_2 [uncultured Caudovirales phage]|uniref:Uncharacterized protein n=1 Tax=uncultured Caudovirales phage TaxID=2100421 RepID=A0A6J5T708_9CAUD|nr:hypothetical protein UFOVP39_2 [uncultured Caudovirales phage]
MPYPALGDMFQNLGPATASMFAGEREQLAQDASLQEQLKQQQAIREAQLKNTQSEAMNPMLLAHQQATNAGQLDTNRKAAVEAALAEGTKDYKLQEAQSTAELDKLKTASQKQSMFADTLGKAGVQLQGVPPVQRFAALGELAKQAGFDINNPAFAGIIQQAQKADPNKLPQMLTGFSQQLAQLAAKNSAAYIQAIDTHKIQADATKEAARIAATSRENVAASKGGGKGVSTIQDLVKAGKMTAEKAAVALFGAAQFEEDDNKKAGLLKMATQYEQFAMNQRNAAAPGKVDVGAMANLPTQQLPPALGGGPKLGTAENPIKLK